MSQNLSDLSAKELKVLATEQGLEFAKNASKAEMLELLTPSLEDEPREATDTVDEIEPEYNVSLEENEYVVLSHITRNGKAYEVGSRITFPERNAEVESLIKDGIIA